MNSAEQWDIGTPNAINMVAEPGIYSRVSGDLIDSQKLLKAQMELLVIKVDSLNEMTQKVLGCLNEVKCGIAANKEDASKGGSPKEPPSPKMPATSGQGSQQSGKEGEIGIEAKAVRRMEQEKHQEEQKNNNKKTCLLKQGSKEN